MLHLCAANLDVYSSRRPSQGLHSLESVEHAARDAQALVKEKFAPVSSGVATVN